MSYTKLLEVLLGQLRVMSVILATMLAALLGWYIYILEVHDYRLRAVTCIVQDVYADTGRNVEIKLPISGRVVFEATKTVGDKIDVYKVSWGGKIIHQGNQGEVAEEK